MSIMKIKTIARDDNKTFEEDVNKYLEHNEELILHNKTVFAITTDTFRGKVHTLYSAIFYGEL